MNQTPDHFTKSFSKMAASPLTLIGVLKIGTHTAIVAEFRALSYCLKFGKIGGCGYVSLVENFALLNPCIEIETLFVDYIVSSEPE